jgi:hypothetical protein
MQQQSLGAHNGHLLFVGNISTRITESELRAMVERFGPVKNVKMRKGQGVSKFAARPSRLYSWDPEGTVRRYFTRSAT